MIDPIYESGELVQKREYYRYAHEFYHHVRKGHLPAAYSHSKARESRSHARSDVRAQHDRDGCFECQDS